MCSGAFAGRLLKNVEGNYTEDTQAALGATRLSVPMGVSRGARNGTSDVFLDNLLHAQELRERVYSKNVNWNFPLSPLRGCMFSRRLNA